MDPAFQSAFNVVKGSPGATDVPTPPSTMRQEGHQGLAEASKKNTLVGSMRTATAVPASIKNAFYDVITRHFNGQIDDKNGRRCRRPPRNCSLHDPAARSAAGSGPRHESAFPAQAAVSPSAFLVLVCVYGYIMFTIYLSFTTSTMMPSYDSKGRPATGACSAWRTGRSRCATSAPSRACTSSSPACSGWPSRS
jgi:hypothetical protein